MSAYHIPEGQLDECPHCVTVFYAFFVAAHEPGRVRNPVVQDHVSRVVNCATRRGFTHADNLARLVANGEQLSESALWIATRLGEAVGVDLMQSMVDDMLAELKSKQFYQPTGASQ